VVSFALVAPQTHDLAIMTMDIPPPISVSAERGRAVGRMVLRPLYAVATAGIEAGTPGSASGLST